MGKQQMLLGRVLDTKYSKQYGSTWKKDFKVLKQKWTNPQNVSDTSASNDDTGEPEKAGDSDDTSEHESSGSEEEDETDPKSFLEKVLTAVRPWSTGGRWKKVLRETSEEKVHKIVQSTRDPKNIVVGEPPPIIKCLDVANPYPGPAESPDYIDIGPGYLHKSLYEYMKQVVAKLHMQYAKVKSMTGYCNLKVYEIYAIPESCKKLDIDGEQYVRVPTLFDPGSDGAAHTQNLEDNLDLYALKSKVINVTTVNGTERKDYERRKIKVRTKEGYIRNYDSIKINSIGREEALVQKYVEKIVELFRMNQQQRNYFLSKTKPEPLQIQLLLGLRSQESLLVPVRAEQLGLIHPWQAPNTSIQYNSHDGELLLVGKLGVNPELFDQDSPTFHVHKTMLGELIKEFKNAQKMVNSDGTIHNMNQPETMRKLNSKEKNDSMMEDAFERLSEKEKIFCSKQINNFIQDVSEDRFIIPLDQLNDSKAQRMNTNMTAGTSNIAEAGTKMSSKKPARDFTRHWNCYLIFVKI